MRCGGGKVVAGARKTYFFGVGFGADLGGFGWTIGGGGAGYHHRLAKLLSP